MIKVASTYPDSLVTVYGVNPTDNADDVQKDLENNPTPYKHLIGRGTTIIKNYKVPSEPWIYIIDHKGTIHTSIMFLTFEDLKKIIDQLLKAK